MSMLEIAPRLRPGQHPKKCWSHCTACLVPLILTRALPPFGIAYRIERAAWRYTSRSYHHEQGGVKEGELIVNLSHPSLCTFNKLSCIVDLLFTQHNCLPSMVDMLFILFFLYTGYMVQCFDMLQEMLFKVREPLVQMAEVFFDQCHSPLERGVLLLSLFTAHLLAGLAHFLSHLTDVFHVVTVCFAVFAVALTDQPSQLRIQPLFLGSMAHLLDLVPLVFRLHGVYLQSSDTTPSVPRLRLKFIPLWQRTS